MARGDFVRSVVPLSEKEASSVLEERSTRRSNSTTSRRSSRAACAQRRSTALSPNFSSPLVAETYFHFVRLLRRINTVTKDTKRVPSSRPSSIRSRARGPPGGIARGRRSVAFCWRTLFNIAEERGAIQSESVQRDGARSRCAGSSMTIRSSCTHVSRLLRSRTSSTSSARHVHARPRGLGQCRIVRGGSCREWRRRARVEHPQRRGARDHEARDHGKKAGFVVTRDHPEARTVLGEFGGLNGDAVERVVTVTTARRRPTTRTRASPRQR